MSAANPNANLAFVVTLTNDYGTTKLVARIFERDSEGDFVPMGSYSRPTMHRSELAEFTVTSYVDRENYSSGGKEPIGLWGGNYRFDSVDIQRADQAREIAKVLTAIEKGMDKLREAQGYLKDGDYAQYLFRIASILRIPSVYFRPSRRQRDMTGQMYKKVNAAELQSLLAHMVDEIHSGKVDQYTR